MVKLDIKVGDTILMGKFKNKKVVVKTIGTDEHGDLTINGKAVLKFRTPKKESMKESTYKKMATSLHEDNVISLNPVVKKLGAKFKVRQGPPHYPTKKQSILIDLDEVQQNTQRSAGIKLVPEKDGVTLISFTPLTTQNNDALQRMSGFKTKANFNSWTKFYSDSNYRGKYFSNKDFAKLAKLIIKKQV